MIPVKGGKPKSVILTAPWRRMYSLKTRCMSLNYEVSPHYKRARKVRVPVWLRKQWSLIWILRRVKSLLYWTSPASSIICIRQPDVSLENLIVWTNIL
jgi:hypothetical protein